MAGSMSGAAADENGTGIRRFCSCRHSEAAHDREHGRCGFCGCLAFEFALLEGGAELPPAGSGRATETGFPDRLTLRQVADRLGLSLSSLRRRVASGEFPAEKLHGKWSMQLHDVHEIETRPAKAPRSGKIRAQLAESESLGHLQGRLRRQGALTSAPIPAGSLESRGRRAERAALEHQLNPGAGEPSAPAAVARGKQQRARLAERESLDDFLNRPSRPEPRERTI